MTMRLAIASDHGGFAIKQTIIDFLSANYGDIEVLDLGPHSTESVDYPDYAKKLCEMIRAGGADRGILICGTGIGMSITANKFKGIHAALCANEFMARMSREHNDSNVLCLGARVIGDEVAKAIVKEWLSTEFGAGRHTRRTNKIKALEG